MTMKDLESATLKFSVGRRTKLAARCFPVSIRTSQPQKKKTEEAKLF